MAQATKVWLVWQLVAAVAAGGTVLTVLGAPWRTDLNWVAGELVVAGLLLAFLRAASGEIVNSMLVEGRFATHVAVAGGGPSAHRTAERLRGADDPLVHVVGTYLTGQQRVTGAADIRGNLRTLLSDCRLGLVDAIVLAVEPEDAEGLRQLRAALKPCVQDIYLAAELMSQAPEGATVFALGATPLLRVSERPIQGWGGRFKRTLDLAGACLLLAFMGPLLLLIALAIKLETPGPILFRQLRVGYNNQLFHIFKFRSMFTDRSDRLAKQQTVQGDTRVTGVGRLIRRLSLDELPQLLNVLRGEMSLVGPRPHAPGTSIGGQRVHTMVHDYACRHRVRPGITGLAQVRGLRGGLETRRQVADRLASDLEYIDTWSLWLDIRIMLGTMMLELCGSRAC